jgi:hypothetical protein
VVPHATPITNSSIAPNKSCPAKKNGGGSSSLSVLNFRRCDLQQWLREPEKQHTLDLGIHREEPNWTCSFKGSRHVRNMNMKTYSIFE